MKKHTVWILVLTLLLSLTAVLALTATLETSEAYYSSTDLNGFGDASSSINGPTFITTTYDSGDRFIESAVTTPGTEQGRREFDASGEANSLLDGTNFISTTFASNNSFAGNMFDIENIGSNIVSITGFDVHVDPITTGISITVYYHPGTYVGHESDATGWVFMGQDIITGQGLGNPTPVDVGGLSISPGESYGLYVTVSNYPSTSMQYTNGANTYSNSDLELTLGIGKGNPDFTGSTFNPRTWNGVIYYEIADITIDKSPDIQTVLLNYPANFSITVTNTGGITLTNVTVSDTLAPDCGNALGELGPGASTSYSCSAMGVTTSFTNTAVVTSTVTGFNGPTASDMAFVEIKPPVYIPVLLKNE